MAEYMNKQPTINIGVIGHVSDGKSTIVKSLTGIAPQKHSDERVRNITIRLGYANAKIAKCISCKPPECYKSFSSSTENFVCLNCGNNMILVRHVSFVDAPGHNMLMQTMLNGTSVMDYTILVESVVNPTIPAPQTVEHLIATEYIGTPNIVVCMNKLDLVDKDSAIKNIDKLEKFLCTTSAKKSPILPLSATFDINMDVLCEILANIPEPKREVTDNFKMVVIRSFNINMPGTDIRQIKGGVIGGSITTGKMKIGDKLTIYPGYIQKKPDMTNNTIWNYKPVVCTVQSINSDKTSLTEAISGGLIAVQFDIDPSLTADDKMVGQVVTNYNSDSYDKNVYEAIAIKINFIDKLTDDLKLEKNDNIVINVNANNIEGHVAKIVKEIYRIELSKPVYIQNTDKITISKKTKNTINIMGIGTFVNGIQSFCLKNTY